MVSWLVTLLTPFTFLACFSAADLTRSDSTFPERVTTPAFTETLI